MRKIFLYSKGCCIESLLDLSVYEKLFTNNGWLVTQIISQADLVLVSTCATPEIKENFSIKNIQMLQRKKRKDARLVVCGCLPAINDDKLSEVFSGERFAPQDKERFKKFFNLVDESLPANRLNTLLPNHLGDFKYPNKIKKILLFFERYYFYIPDYLYRRFIWMEDSTMFYIRVSVGCVGSCTYCAIKKAKGNLISKQMKDILAEFRVGLREGYKTYVLSGDDIGCYGQDIAINIITLLRELIKEPGEYKLMIRFIEPEWLIKYFSEFEQIFATGKIAALCAPIQSGSNKILKAMNRQYLAEDIVRCLSLIRHKFPDIYLRTHFIVGFPGETGKDFKQSLAILDSIDFDLVMPSEYHSYKCTKAYTMTGQLSKFTKKKRFLIMLLKVLLNVFLNMVNVKLFLKKKFL